jgi:thiol-disulfide isomerase/thioredoxin
MTAIDFAQKFSQAFAYADYLKTGTDEQQRRWTSVYNSALLNDAQRQLVGGFVRQMNVLIISGIWCGDCVEQCPLLQRIAEANPAKISLRLVDRDQHRDLAEHFRMNEGDRVPVALFLAEDFAFCGALGDRTLHRYRAIAGRKLGAACPIGIAAPESGELNATLADWLGEFERIQLLLRLSARLRKKHGD